MKALYISPYLGFSGYSAAARGYVKALHDHGVDLVLRNIQYDSGDEHQLEEWERDLFTKAPKNVDVIIQHLTPNEMARKPNDNNTKHVAVVATETDNVNEVWSKSLNRMDAVITFCDMSVEAMKKGGITIPVYKVPHAFDISSYNADGVEPFKVGAEEEDKEKPLIFYNISQISTKKGIDKLLRAYFGAFQKGENVVLLLKGYFDMANRSNEEDRITRFLGEIRKEVKIRQVSPVVVMTDIMNDEQIKRIHATGDVYVNASNGEGFCIPLFEAVAYGNSAISPLWGGPAEFLTEESCYPVQYAIEPCYGMNHPLPYMYSSNENWAETSVTSLIAQMQRAYKDWTEDNLMKPPCVDRFDYSVIGPEFIKVLEEVCNNKVLQATSGE